MMMSLAALATPVGAQDRPFVFSLANARPEDPARTTTLRVDYDLGGGERLFQGDRGHQPEQQLAVHASHGRFLLIGRVNLVLTASSFEAGSSGELLYSLRDPGPRGVAFAAGGGVMHEVDGTNVLLARAIGSHEAASWRIHGNVLMQKPLDPARDAIDLITSVGWARHVTRALALGVEAVGEDLEGFWEQEEAEGGARLLVGPSLQFAPAGRRWQLVAAGGPTFHPRDTGQTSGATRDLPPATSRYGYAVKAALTYRVF
jgi:hypothetical protein